jgi:hypothetical protein
MPQLNSEKAQKVRDAEDNFSPVPRGIYILELTEDVEVGEGQKGAYWKWTFEIPEGETGAGRRFWLNTSLSDNAFFKLKETFAAFGEDPEVATEDLLKRRVRGVVSVQTIQKGQRAGQLGNNLDRILPLDGPTGEGIDGEGNKLPEDTATVKKDGAAPLF